jgi:predicted nucleotide-binding protein
VLELGYFMAALGRNRVAALVEEGTEQPSDIHGIVYLPLDHEGA